MLEVKSWKLIFHQFLQKLKKNQISVACPSCLYLYAPYRSGTTCPFLPRSSSIPSSPSLLRHSLLSCGFASRLPSSCLYLRASSCVCRCLGCGCWMMRMRRKKRMMRSGWTRRRKRNFRWRRSQRTKRKSCYCDCGLSSIPFPSFSLCRCPP